MHHMETWRLNDANPGARKGAVSRPPISKSHPTASISKPWLSSPVSRALQISHPGGFEVIELDSISRILHFLTKLDDPPRLKDFSSTPF
ncbi:hypothetical protein PGTUg99_015142 [Puccinia graminis f. sp. tritici]|uniref:Uncharacterized protein n=1 Tax=Puccinia graminis f. sp. tritici TaxID=56615 RepID=A0A5B0REI3_PUCGR|nr:hypothetical protein PGTUg99_015142 [Puccinia graminis f. sp. tritici]